MIYAAFLRSVNVSGRLAPSATLKALFERAGFSGVKTLLASGNVRFETPETGRDKVRAAIENALRDGLGFEVGVQLRTLDELRGMIDGQPFRGIEVTPRTRLYVSFVSGTPKGDLPVPYSSGDGELRVLKFTGSEIYGVVLLSPTTGTTDYMALVEKEFGKDLTTRNWNTVLKLVQAAGGN